KEISDKWLGSLERETAVGGPTVCIGVLAKRGTEKCRQKWGLTVDYLILNHASLQSEGCQYAATVF
ncbi:MAG: hypothetical protein U9N77_00755, partial [Thermodesulfobacteriota bacterium]|nr:hypothetical protein [Thermodesulfobacteriota bacterium]